MSSWLIAFNLRVHIKRLIKYKKVPWREIAGTRDKISHHYFGVDIELIWKIVKEDSNSLKKQMMVIKKDLIKI